MKAGGRESFYGNGTPEEEEALEAHSMTCMRAEWPGSTEAARLRGNDDAPMELKVLKNEHPI